MCRVAAVAASLILATSLPLAAQRSVAREDRVRITLRDKSGQPVVGRVSTIRKDTVVVWSEGESLLRPITSDKIEKVEISRGKRSKVGMGALIGFAAGAVGGLVVAVADGDNCNGFCPVDQTAEAGIAALVFGVVGTAVGAAVGFATRGEHWEVAALPQ